MKSVKWSAVLIMMICCFSHQASYGQVTATATGTTPPIYNKGDASVTLTISTSSSKLVSGQNYTMYYSTKTPAEIAALSGSGHGSGTLTYTDDLNHANVAADVTVIGTKSSIADGDTLYWNNGGTGGDSWTTYSNARPADLSGGQYYLYFANTSQPDSAFVAEIGPVEIKRAILGSLPNKATTKIDITWYDDDASSGGNGTVKLYTDSVNRSSVADIYANSTLRYSVAENNSTNSYAYDVTGLGHGEQFYIFIVNDIGANGVTFDTSSVITVDSLILAGPNGATVQTNGDLSTYKRYDYQISWADNDAVKKDTIDIYYDDDSTLTITQVLALPDSQKITSDTLNTYYYDSFYWTLATNASTDDGVLSGTYYLYAVVKNSGYKRMSKSPGGITVSNLEWMNLTEPNGSNDIGSATTFDLTWQARDFDGNAAVKLYYISESVSTDPGAKTSTELASEGTLITTTTENGEETSIAATALLVACHPDSISDNETFTLYSAATSGNIVFGLDKSGGVSGADVTVDISSSSSAADVATQIQAAVDAQSSFSATRSGSVVTITQATAGVAGNQVNSYTVHGGFQLTRFSGGVTGSGTPNSYTWTIGSLTKGYYYIYGLIGDTTVVRASTYLHVTHPPTVTVSLPSASSGTNVFNLAETSTMPIKWEDNDPDNATGQVIEIYITDDVNGARNPLENGTATSSDITTFLAADSNWHLLSVINGSVDGLGHDNYDWDVRSYVADSISAGATPNIIADSTDSYNILVIIRSGGEVSYDLSDDLTFQEGGLSVKVFSPADEMSLTNGEIFQIQFDASAIPAAGDTPRVVFAIVNAEKTPESEDYAGIKGVGQTNSLNDWYFINSSAAGCSTLVNGDGITVDNSAYNWTINVADSSTWSWASGSANYNKNWKMYALLSNDGQWLSGVDAVAMGSSVGTFKIVPNSAAGTQEIYFSPNNVTVVNDSRQTFNIGVHQSDAHGLNILDIHFSFSNTDFDTVLNADGSFFTSLQGFQADGGTESVLLDSIYLSSGTYYANFQVTNTTGQNVNLPSTGTEIASFTLKARNVAEYTPVSRKVRFENDPTNLRQTKYYAGATTFYPQFPPSGGAIVSITPRGSIKGQVHFQGKSNHQKTVWLELRKSGGTVPISDSTFVLANDSLSYISVGDSGLISYQLTSIGGDFELFGVGPGSYDVVAYTAGYLRGVHKNVVVGPGEHVNDVLPVHYYNPSATPVYVSSNSRLIAGDLTGANNVQDNKVFTEDRNLIMSTDIYNKSVSVSSADSCDFNDDGIVNVEDLSYVFANENFYGQVSLLKPLAAYDNSEADLSVEIEPVEENPGEYILNVYGTSLSDVRAYGFTVAYNRESVKFTEGSYSLGDIFTGIRSDGVVRDEADGLTVVSSLIGRGSRASGDHLLMSVRFRKLNDKESGIQINAPILINSEMEARHLGALITNIDDQISVIPEEFSLKQNYPNPFNPSTTIEFGLPKQADVTIRIYDLSGRLVKQLINKSYEPGMHKVVWHGRTDLGIRVASGMYIYKFTAGNYSFTRKMILLK